jgi:hypothetical protein
MPHTPTYSSWLNGVERRFALLTDKKRRRGAHRSIQALEKDIRDWIADWNQNPRPFTWTKTADEIFERLTFNEFPAQDPADGKLGQIIPRTQGSCTFGMTIVISSRSRRRSRGRKRP